MDSALQIAHRAERLPNKSEPSALEKCRLPRKARLLQPQTALLSRPAEGSVSDALCDLTYVLRAYLEQTCN